MWGITSLLRGRRASLVPAVLCGAGVIVFVTILASDALAKRSVWSEARHPAKGAPRAIGSYTAGCLQGGTGIALSGPGYEVMRPHRRRFFGHPELVSMIEDLGTTLLDSGHGPILVGDLGQPKGGPSARGHASHQSGLDVDIWFWHPKQAEKRTLTRRERRKMPNHRVVDPKKLEYTKYWSEDVSAMIFAAAADERVSRVLVNPLIKKRLCESKGPERALLRKIRPWYGHADHMHVRLHCPADSKECVPQNDVPEDDGCGDLDWWLSKKAKKDRKKGKKDYLSNVGALPPLPTACSALVKGKRRSSRKRRSRRSR